MELRPLTWRKASRSTGNGGNCGNCVEVADAPGHVAVRDSKDPGGPHIVLTRADFQHLAASLKHL
ncbi:DUF397 domain-containing protein [Actinomadura terrae]|uniref:DUF397 domain-containing protein n=1 Tax=Actinomadura terrae TaxID=604353 RepID=UPI001FA76EF8|nr:DUF397 domain-containing protein [Actinomadura terrae]